MCPATIFGVMSTMSCVPACSTGTLVSADNGQCCYHWVASPFWMSCGRPLFTPGGPRVASLHRRRDRAWG
jgi:hypothetical protein